MRKNGISASTTAVLCILLIACGTLLPSGEAWGVAGQAIPPPTLLPLNQIPVPEPPNLFQFVKNKPAAIRLGKALFWDMQAGSDDVQACASCHFHAGADNRLKNTVNPGTRGSDNTFQVRGPNGTLDPTPVTGNFPFHQRDLPDFQASKTIRDSNDVVGSQGVTFTNFVKFNAVTGKDEGLPVADQVFNTLNVVTAIPNTPAPLNPDPANNTRRVTARNTPTNINAIFNFNNFWDGRAHFLFNGVNPFGPLDPTAGVWFNVGTPATPTVPANPVLQKQKVAIEFASLASQATGPPLDDTEMSFSGRTFPELARKMLSTTPLKQQFVHPNDSVLGSISNAVLLANGKLGGATGINIPYSKMIQDAFQDNLWNADPLKVTVFTKTFPSPAGELFSQMEANFSLFWGLAIQLYEATLVSDQTPFDRFLGGDKAALTAQQQDGFNIFFGAGGCSACHISTELTNASVRAAAFVTNASNALIEPMTVANAALGTIIYDNGFNNTAVRPTTEDIGRGGTAPAQFVNARTGLPFPLSFSLLSELQALGNLGFDPTLFPPGAPLTPVLPVNIPATTAVANDGNFKIPGLRNVELTAPYFHNGGVMTLEDVVDFYTRGANFPAANANSLDTAIVQIGALQNNPTGMAALVAFMKSMTDDRVLLEKAPFDHPELLIPNGPHVVDPNVLERIPAKGANGAEALPSNFRIDPVVSPTNSASQAITGTKDVGASIQVQVNNNPTVPVGAPADAIWSATVSGFVEGSNTVTVISTDASGVVSLKATITLDTATPALSLNAVTTPSRNGDQIISGTVEAGITPVVKVSPSATVGPVKVIGTAWSAPLTLLNSGSNTITVTATDPAGNVATQTATITVFGDGIFNGTRIPDISDALKALRIAVGLITPTANDLQHGDVAPLGAPDGKIDVSDALLIMRNVVGTIALIN